MKVIDNLAEFHCFYLDSNQLKKIEGDYIFAVNDDRIKKYFRAGLDRFMVHDE